MMDSEKADSASASSAVPQHVLLRAFTLVRGAAGRRAFAVAVVVGSLLNLINQGDALLAGHIDWAKLVLTYLVPFFVSLHGAAFAERSRR